LSGIVALQPYVDPLYAKEYAYLAKILRETEEERSLQDQEQSCYYPDFPLINLRGYGPSFPTQCTGCQNATDPECTRNPCWCIPEGGTTGCCPDPGERPLYYEFQVSDAFRRNRLTLSEPIVFTPEGCDPWPQNIELYNSTMNITLCDRFPDMDIEGTVCAFIYREDDPDCGGLDGREYGLQTFNSYEAAVAAGAAPTHTGGTQGFTIAFCDLKLVPITHLPKPFVLQPLVFFLACGACSSAQDLGVMMDSRMAYDGDRSNCAVISVGDAMRPDVPVREGAAYQCYLDLGYSPECAFFHASSDIVGRFCTAPCQIVLENLTPPSLYSCELNDCVQCETDLRTDEYIKWAGRNLVSSGLIAYQQYWHQKHDCSIYIGENANPIILQDPYHGANSTSEPLPVTPSESADRFDPSYRFLVNPETCFYDFTFSMKHDPTLPHAGGWNTDYPNGVTREEFDAVCSRDSNAIASDGRPYRERRKFVFNFGDDVKSITGLFDHMSIDYNPCGHHDETFFGRAHYDMHMYTVSEEWRTIMNCETTPCDPNDCKFDQNFQTLESGKAFFDYPECTEPFPSYITDVLPPLPSGNIIDPGFSNVNMPFGFVSLSHTGVPHSGLHAINLLTALQWNNTQVERWTEPFMFMMSFDNLVTVYEPMVPVEFFQGPVNQVFRSPESPPLCQTLLGMPLTYNASFSNFSNFTTFQYLGLSPLCACEAGMVPAEACSLNDAELAKYDETYRKFKGETMAPTPAPAYFGRYTIEEVEAAFSLAPGSLIVEGDEGFDCLYNNNFWTDWEGKPLVLSRFNSIFNTTRNGLFQTIVPLALPLFSYERDRYLEHTLLGCFYRDKSEEINRELIDMGLSFCANLPDSFTGLYVQYHVVAYIDEYTRLLYFGYRDYFKDDVQFMTQFVLARIVPDFELMSNEVFAYQLIGPNATGFQGFRDPWDVAYLEHSVWLGNHGDFIVTLEEADLTEPCPEKMCGSIVPGVIPNPEAPDAPWPQKILDNECNWYYCTASCSASTTNCSSFEPGLCAASLPDAEENGTSGGFSLVPRIVLMIATVVFATFAM
jgi:hypothetical protein